MTRQRALKWFVHLQADAEGAGAVVVPHALADLGHGLCRLHVCLLFPWEVTPIVPVLGFDTINLKPNTGSRVFKENRGHTPNHIAGFFFLFLNLQVQIGGAVGICGHGSSSCSRRIVHGKDKWFKCCLSVLLKEHKLSFLNPLPLQQVSCYCVRVHCQ